RRREDPLLLRDVLLEDVRLDGAAQPLERDALLLPDAGVEGEEHRRRPVDRHRRRDLAERDPVEERLHVRERVDRHALAPDLAERARMVRVVAHQGRHVERGREAGLAVLEEVAEPRVRLLRRAEAGELPHRPEPAAVHRRVDAAREGIRPRPAEVAFVVELDVLRRVERLVLDPGDRGEELTLAFRRRRVALAPVAGRPFGVRRRHPCLSVGPYRLRVIRRVIPRMREWLRPIFTTFCLRPGEGRRIRPTNPLALRPLRERLSRPWRSKTLSQAPYGAKEQKKCQGSTSSSTSCCCWRSASSPSLSAAGVPSQASPPRQRTRATRSPPAPSTCTTVSTGRPSARRSRRPTTRRCRRRSAVHSRAPATPATSSSRFRRASSRR